MARLTWCRVLPSLWSCSTANDHIDIVVGNAHDDMLTQKVNMWLMMLTSNSAERSTTITAT